MIATDEQHASHFEQAVPHAILFNLTMGRREKLIRSICARLPEARFIAVRSLLEAFGWKRDRQPGSHVTFVKPEEYPITVPVHNEKVGRIYLTEICDRLHLDGETT